MVFKTNIKLDEVNANTIYAGKGDLSNVIGILDDYDIENKSLSITGRFLESQKAISAQEMLLINAAQLTTSGYGRINPETKEVEGYKLQSMLILEEKE